MVGFPGTGRPSAQSQSCPQDEKAQNAAFRASRDEDMKARADGFVSWFQSLKEEEVPATGLQ